MLRTRSFFAMRTKEECGYSGGYMTNTELNKYHRGRMQGTCREAVQFDWQDGEFMDFLLGGLPVINKEGLREQVQDKQVQDKYYRLEKAYQTYSFFSTDNQPLQRSSAHTQNWSGPHPSHSNQTPCQR